MKIVQALGWYYPESLGGTEVYVSALAKRLMASDHEVLIAAPRPGARIEVDYRLDGLSVYRYPTPSHPTRDEAQGCATIRGGNHFHKRLQEFRPDVVHFHSLLPGLSLPELRAAKATGAKLVVTSHASRLGFICQRGTLMQWGERPCDGLTEVQKCAACELHNRGLPKVAAIALSVAPSAISKLARRSDTRLGTAIGMPDLIARNKHMQAEMLQLVDYFVVLTNWAARIVELNGVPPSKLVLNRLGLSQTGVFHKPSADTHPTLVPIRIGYLGRFEQVKGVLAMARAISRLPRALDCRFEFRGPLLTDVERLVHREIQDIVNTDERVTFAPAVSSAEAPAILASYDLLCCPSECAEGGPTVAIEAQAVGTPVIGTRIGGLNELVSDGVNGRLVEAGDVAGLTAVFEEVARFPQRIDQWRQNLAPVRTMDDVTGDYLRLY